MNEDFLLFYGFNTKIATDCIFSEVISLLFLVICIDYY